MRSDGHPASAEGICPLSVRAEACRLQRPAKPFLSENFKHFFCIDSRCSEDACNIRVVPTQLHRKTALVRFERSLCAAWLERTGPSTASSSSSPGSASRRQRSSTKARARQMATISECRSRWLRAPATTLICNEIRANTVLLRPVLRPD